MYITVILLIQDDPTISIRSRSLLEAGSSRLKVGIEAGLQYKPVSNISLFSQNE